MSSFLQKNQLIKKGVLTTKQALLPCLECGQIAMQLIQADCKLSDGTFIPNLEFYQCLSCKSKFYNNSAMETIETIRQKENLQSSA